MRFTANYPAYFDGAESEISTKGYFGDLEVKTEDGRTYRPIFYDVFRYSQEVRDVLSIEPCMAQSNIVVLEVDRQHIDAALAWLAVHGFSELVAEV